jgi:DNA-binding CsgD family transcriptional regulator
MEGDAGSDQTVLKTRLMVTDREAEVLLWIARGKSNRDIAEILSLSPRTVNKHLEQIFTKLGVENRTSAAALAVRTLGVR